MYLFNLPLEIGVFPDSLKIAKVTPLFKTGGLENFGNYRPILSFFAFQKMLERVMYNRVYNDLTENNLLYKKQFVF